MSVLELIMKLCSRLRHVDSNALVRIVTRGPGGEVVRVEEARIHHVGNFGTQHLRICVNAADIHPAPMASFVQVDHDPPY